jgi:L-rhamnose isomerase
VSIKGQTHCWFSVPPFVLGRPSYQHSHCIRYITEKLKYGGFAVTDLTGQGSLFIDWGRKNNKMKRKNKEESAGVKVVDTSSSSFAETLKNLSKKYDGLGVTSSGRKKKKKDLS